MASKDAKGILRHDTSKIVDTKGISKYRSSYAQRREEKPYCCEHIRNGSLCKKCSSNKTCADKQCPLYKYRKG